MSREDLATFAGGCFWCMGGPFEKLDGVKRVIAGYTGGHKTDPTYEEVYTDSTGHAEAVQITFDPDRVTYRSLLDMFWMQIDPTDPGGQFIDRGTRYQTGIFYHTDRQRELAEKSKQELEASGKFNKPIATEITRFEKFWPAEEEHQRFHIKNPAKYKQEREESGRDDFISKTWEQSE